MSEVFPHFYAIEFKRFLWQPLLWQDLLQRIHNMEYGQYVFVTFENEYACVVCSDLVKLRHFNFINYIYTIRREQTINTWKVYEYFLKFFFLYACNFCICMWQHKAPKYVL